MKLMKEEAKKKAAEAKAKAEQEELERKEEEDRLAAEKKAADKKALTCANTFPHRVRSLLPQPFAVPFARSRV